MSAHEASSSEDEAPQAVSFQTAKNENIEQLQKVKEQVSAVDGLALIFGLLNNAWVYSLAILAF